MIKGGNSALKSKYNLFDFISFIAPSLIFIEINLIGRLFVPEIILLATLFYFFVIGKAWISTTSKRIFFLGLLWLLAQVVTDLILGVETVNFLRGWSNISFFLLEYLAIYLIVNNSKRRLLFFAIGISIGQIFQYLINPNEFAIGGDYWKFGIGFAITFLFVIGSSLSIISYKKYLSCVILLGTAVLNFMLEYRSLGGVCALTSIYLFLSARSKINSNNKRIGFRKYVSTISLVIFTGIILSTVYGVMANNGVFGQNAKQKYEVQSGGVFGLLLGGRQEIFVSSLAIMDSPILGHGSWAKDEKYSNLMPELLKEYGYEDAQVSIYGGDLEGLIPTHSFLFGAWVNSGFLGALFWGWVLLLVLKVLIGIYGAKSNFSSLIAFSAINLTWNILFSPLGAETRLYAAYFLVVIVFATENLLMKIESA